MAETKFIVRLTCCGRDDGKHGPCSWAEADAFRESYLSGPGVKDPEHPGRGGHERSAIIEAAALADLSWVSTG
jgi:hypothetical protein